MSSRQEDHAMLICKLAQINSGSEDASATASTTIDNALCDYKTFLENYGYSVELKVPSNHDSSASETIKVLLTEAAAQITKSQIFIVLYEESTGVDVNDLLNCMKRLNNEAEKMLVICKIDPEESESSTDVYGTSLKEFCDGPANLRNLIVLGGVAKSKKMAADFIAFLKKITQKSWDSTGLKDIDWHIKVQQQKMYRLYTHVPKSMSSNFERSLCLKDTDHFKKMIGNGEKYKSLDETVIKLLKESKNGKFVYKVDTKGAVQPRAMIINNIKFNNESLNRYGSDVDYENLRHVLHLMQYHVTEKKDLTAQQIEEVVTDFVTTKHGDACILVILSHGSPGSICGTDYQNILGNNETGTVKEEILLQLMCNGKEVKGKPRLFLIQACRPNAKQSTEDADSGTAEEVGKHYYGRATTAIELPRDHCGLIVGYSTSPGELSYRNLRGSRFITSVCATFYEYAYLEDVVSMTTRINYIMTHGFEEPNGELSENETSKLQLADWRPQVDKKFFLVDTSALFGTD